MSGQHGENESARPRRRAEAWVGPALAVGLLIAGCSGGKKPKTPDPNAQDGTGKAVTDDGADSDAPPELPLELNLTLQATADTTFSNLDDQRDA